MEEKYKLYQGDCLDIMKKIIKQGIKVNSVICDIPYGTTACLWDEVIPFDKMWDLLDQITYDDSPIILFSSQPFTSKLINSNIKNFKEELVWLKNKGSSGLLAKQKHIKVHENIIVFSNTSKYTYNPQKWYVSDDFIIKRNTLKITEETNNIIGNVTKGRVRKKDDGSRNPISVLAYKIPYSPKKKSQSKNGDYRMHPTQKPLLLMDYLVKTFSNENDIILDFTMGSGTTGVACMKNNRKFIGIELDENYFQIASKRVAEYSNQKLLSSAT